MTTHTTGTREEWLAARNALLEREKELTRRSDELARERRALPWVRVDEEYVFETDDGPRTLGELFDGRTQLLVYHLMFGPDDTEACVGCSYTADALQGGIVHLEDHGVKFVTVSRGPLERLQAYKRRMGWEFDWASSHGTRFNPDFTALSPFDADMELHGLSAFALEDGVVHHTYSTFDRGTDVLNGVWQLLDRAPGGRDGAPEDWPRRHDEYERAAAAGA